MTLRIEFLRAKLDAALTIAPKSIAREMRVAFQEYGADFTKRFTVERLTKSGTPSFGDSRPGLFRRTGSLARGFVFKTFGGEDIDQLLLRIGWLDPRLAQIAQIHEEGKTITGNPWLAIPLQAALTPAGVLRRPPREWPNTFFARSKKGNLILFQNSRRGIVPLFVLKQQVRIPARLGFVDKMTSPSEEQIRLRMMNRAIVRGLRKAT